MASWHGMRLAHAQAPGCHTGVARAKPTSAVVRRAALAGERCRISLTTADGHKAYLWQSLRSRRWLQSGAHHGLHHAWERSQRSRQRGAGAEGGHAPPKIIPLTSGALTMAAACATGAFSGTLATLLLFPTGASTVCCLPNN